MDPIITWGYVIDRTIRCQERAHTHVLQKKSLMQTIRYTFISGAFPSRERKRPSVREKIVEKKKNKKKKVEYASCRQL